MTKPVKQPHTCILIYTHPRPHTTAHAGIYLDGQLRVQEVGYMAEGVEEEGKIHPLFLRSGAEGGVDDDNIGLQYAIRAEALIDLGMMCEAPVCTCACTYVRTEHSRENVLVCTHWMCQVYGASVAYYEGGVIEMVLHLVINTLWIK